VRDLRQFLTRSNGRPLFDRDRIGRPADSTLDGQRISDEERLVDAVFSAVCSELVEVEHLPDEETNLWDRDAVPWLIHPVDGIWPHLNAPRIRGHAGDL
jgi:hypothetical protein